MNFKDVYNVSLCKNGILGGLLYVKEDALIYCTNKLTVPEKIRRLQLRHDAIRNIEIAPFHTVRISMINGEKYRFFVFSRGKFMRRIGVKK